MPRSCDICGKAVRIGRSIVRHGMSKKQGGIGLHTTGISRRLFAPNLHRVRVAENGGTRRRVVCTACIKSGKVAKA
ncbi:MAG: 50S ribosomal protein L28 [Lentisphaerae bacterium RIFOXYC12_FULL_60_16]|nr:MAG: 50S ribosomal protein L28 [Lentisphaerae bacterium RIFOXYC12_FULL_60_16]OGV85014.1 MAG: 50S ribosomal protein L28 [Lentisphaerae bacterium RIFOXYB12_FULL_60_10]